MISTVAIVRNINHTSTKISYDLEDMTGTISAHLWIEDNEAPTISGVNINTYVRVVGSVRQQGDEKLLLVYKIQPVEGINEVNTHFLEVVNARYMAEGYVKGGVGVPMGREIMEIDPAPTQMVTIYTQGMKDGKSEAVYKAIQASGSSQNGMNRQDLYRTFSHISENEMARILDNMLEGGHIYSTIDSDHFHACF